MRATVTATIARKGTTADSMRAEHLQLLRELAQELERAMDAIARNSLRELEDSIARQEDLSLLLHEAIAKRKAPVGAEAEAKIVDADLGWQIQIAAEALRKLNLRYSMLLQHASCSVFMMISLFQSARGKVQEGAGGRLQHATWSCHG